MEGNDIPNVLNVGLLHEAEKMLEDLELNRDISGVYIWGGNIQ
jgi:hypothetical protein